MRMVRPSILPDIRARKDCSFCRARSHLIASADGLVTTRMQKNSSFWLNCRWTRPSSWCGSSQFHGAVTCTRPTHLCLDVGADAELFGGADEDGDLAVAAGAVQLFFRCALLGLVDEPDQVAGHPAADELGAGRV